MKTRREASAGRLRLAFPVLVVLAALGATAGTAMAQNKGVDMLDGHAWLELECDVSGQSTAWNALPCMS